jgi:hypothetical protein
LEFAAFEWEASSGVAIEDALEQEERPGKAAKKRSQNSSSGARCAVPVKRKVQEA